MFTPDTTPKASARYDVDELAAAVGLPLRRVRFYLARRLLPPGSLDGRAARYDERHRARLELIRTLQDHGLRLDAVERHLRNIPMSAAPEAIALRGALFKAWQQHETTTPELRGTKNRARRHVDAAALEQLPTMRASGDSENEADAMATATSVIERRTDALVDELSSILSSNDPNQEALTFIRSVSINVVASRFGVVADDAIRSPFRN
ncbi:MerR family transcriptional regulator [Nocardioides marmoriginsengisoli]|uniref:MerR family transcriptional regulator n=1 Tax=Nocardioides marmoriginsengisoli TaxID=661483 RepID=A0A3N0CIB6_9ACTN|nr:MerR family transcriptional regulator [Nocardioides marmoriginsengisoli]RNL62756.1 MerR family transcriptional regulator [Nocardioides marmoriginsengisoli]